MAQNLLGNLRRIIIQRKGNRPLSGAEKSNIISAAHRAMTTSRNSCRFQTCQVNSKRMITIMTREKKAAVEALKNSSDLIREIGKVYTEVTSIQPDKTWNRLKMHDVSIEGGVYFRPGNIRAGILRIRQDLEEENTDLKLIIEPR
jgi:hypothetical protein